MLYLLNTPILTSYGTFEFNGPLSLEEAKKQLKLGFVSAIGHSATADFLSQILAIDIPSKRVSIHMQPGDSAIVFCLKERLPEGFVYDTVEALQQVNYEMARLTRMA